MKIKHVTSEREIEQIEGIWENLQWHPNADKDYFLQVIRDREEIERPHIIVASRGESVVMLVGRKERYPVEFTFGYHKLAAKEVDCITFIYGGVLGQWSEDSSMEVVRDIERYLSESNTMVAHFSHLAVESPLYSALVSESTGLTHRFDKSNHWRLDVSGEYDDFVSGLSRSNRRNLKYYANRLERSFDRMEVTCFREDDEVPDLMEANEAIAVKTYQRGLGVGFHKNAETRNRLKVAAKKGWLRGYVLFLDGKPAAFWVCFKYKGGLYTGDTGYDPEYESYRIGSFLLNTIFQEAFSSDDTSFIDFGFGDASYKRGFCDTSWVESSVYRFAPGVRGRLLGAAKSANVKCEKVIRSSLAAAGAEQRVKKIWRNWVRR